MCWPVGRPGGVEQALLGDEHERPRRMAAGRHVGLGRGDLLQRPAEVQRPRPAAVGVGPRHGLGQRVVHLEHAGPVPEPAAVGARYPLGSCVAADPQQLAGGDVEQHRTRVRARRRAMRTGRPVSIEPPSSASRLAMASAIACDPPRAAGQPATCPEASSMSPGAEVSGRDEREERVGRGAGEEAGGLVGGEGAAGDGGGWDAHADRSRRA